MKQTASAAILVHLPRTFCACWNGLLQSIWACVKCLVELILNSEIVFQNITDLLVGDYINNGIHSYLMCP